MLTLRYWISMTASKGNSLTMSMRVHEVRLVWDLWDVFIDGLFYYIKNLHLRYGLKF